MTFKRKTGLVLSILVGSGLAPVALTAQPAQALDICVGDDLVSVNVAKEIIDPNYVFSDAYLFSNEAESRRAEIREKSKPWYTNGSPEPANSLSEQFTVAFFIYKAKRVPNAPADYIWYEGKENGQGVNLHKSLGSVDQQSSWDLANS